MKFLAGLILLLNCIHSPAQFGQQFRGTVTDQVLQQPLAGATVTLTPLGNTVTTDAEGLFRFTGIPVGTYKLLVTYTGYKEAVLENILVNAGKETVIQVRLEAWVRTQAEAVVKAIGKKNKPLNDMSLVSARAFTVEETQKYAAAVNDPLRMATAFAGVFAADDGNNSIIIRGNSSTGLLWRMEGMDIPNPNHFGTPGNSGGGISILSSQLLANSDFITGAFAPEYGNALSGVFDLKLRKGNNEKREYSLQAGVLGLNAAIEGPFAKSYKGSYLLNYRYSTLTLLNKLGVLPDEGATNFRDLSYNFNFPTRKMGTFSFFGFGGWSDDKMKAKEAGKWESKSDRYTEDFFSNTSHAGITHTLLAGNKWNIKSGIGISKTKIGFDQEYTEDDQSVSPTWSDKYKTNNRVLQSTVNYKFNNRLHLRTGVIAHFIRYDFYQQSPEHEGGPLREVLNVSGNTSTQQAFAQALFRPTDNTSLQAGLHFFRLSHNRTQSAEPRISAKWIISRKSSLALAYGLHSQMQTLSIYFARLQEPNGNIIYPNKDLGLTRAQHYVLSYQYKISRNLLAKAELYYQRLSRVPVSIYDSSSLSALNILNEYVVEPMENTGKGRNYGAELSLERYLDNHFYLTLNNSIYQSKYTAKDGVERNTRFNGNYIITLIAGKDFVHEWRPRTIGLNLKTIYAGGMRTTPVDVAASTQNGYTIFRDKEAFSLQNPSYFRTDLRLSLTWNRRHHTSTLSLDFQNLTNRLNVFNQWYDSEKNEVVTNYQTGLIPILNYKIEF